jgi:hypothetical protein
MLTIFFVIAGFVLVGTTTTSSSVTRTATPYTSDQLDWRFSKMPVELASDTGMPTRSGTPQCRL